MQLYVATVVGAAAKILNIGNTAEQLTAVSKNRRVFIMNILTPVSLSFSYG
jgi:hypothetical protein